MLNLILMVLRPDRGLHAGLSDERLFESYIRGDVSAFESLLKRHEQKVFNFILRFVGQPERANDLLQDTFMKVLRNAQSYRPTAQFKTWLYTIARNTCIDELRKKKTRRTDTSFEQTPRATGGMSVAEKTAGSRDDGYRAAENLELRTRLETAIGELSEEQREALLMKHLTGMKFREIAEVLGTSENTVKSRVRYALENLRGHLADYASHVQPSGALEGNG